jgi:hypothetical protein
MQGPPRRSCSARSLLIAALLGALMQLADCQEIVLPKPLTQKQIKQFKRYGVLVVPGALNDTEVKNAQAGMHRYLPVCACACVGIFVLGASHSCTWIFNFMPTLQCEWILVGRRCAWATWLEFLCLQQCQKLQYCSATCVKTNIYMRVYMHGNVYTCLHD